MSKESLKNNSFYYQNNYILKKLLFPLYPINFFRSTLLICLLSMLISLRIVLQFITIPLPQFGMVLSIAHTPLMIIGWLFGPIIGFFSGVITDTICYFAKPTSQWFWLYAIQEPLLGMIAGFIGSLYLIRRNLNFKNETFIIKTILYIFVLFTFFVILLYATPSNSFQGGSGLEENNFFNIYKYIAIVVIILFLIIYESFFFFINKRKKDFARMFLYVSTIPFINAIFFSFFLGTISIVEYNKLFFPGNNNFIKYGAMFYVIPRVVKESIKTPLQITLLFSIIIAITPLFENFLNNINLSWNKKNTK